jgi:Trk K+ transport system NAD-binding subunit
VKPPDGRRAAGVTAGRTVAQRAAAPRHGGPAADGGEATELPAPPAFAGRTLRPLELRPRHGLTLVAIKRRVAGSDQETTNVAPSADDRIEANDVLVVLGSNERLAPLDRLLKG